MCLAMVLHNMIKILPIHCKKKGKEWVSQYKKNWNEVEPQLFEKLATEPIKWKYVRGKLKTWKKDIKTNFHGQIVP